MAKQASFSVSKKGHKGVTVTTQRRPETLEEFESEGLVSSYPQDVIDLAWQNLVIKMQSGARSRLEQGEDAVQEYVDNYKYGARTGGPIARKPKISEDKAKDLKFTEAQLQALAAAGVEVEGMGE